MSNTKAFLSLCIVSAVSAAWLFGNFAAWRSLVPDQILLSVLGTVATGVILPGLAAVLFIDLGSKRTA